ncbi:DNA topoisomerase isoform 1 [Tanacetum coccineum]
MEMYSSVAKKHLQQSKTEGGTPKSGKLAEQRKGMSHEKMKNLYRQYTTEEIEEATEYFSDTRRIGEGGYGPVYKCHLDNIPLLSWQHRFRIAAKICSGLLFLHQTKPANILLDRNSVSKVADVGLARLVPPSVKTQ